MTLDQILRSLEDRNLSVVAERTGLGVATLYRLTNDAQPGPRRATLELLARYLSEGAESYEDKAAQ